MMKLILVSAARTSWAAQGRLAGDADLPLDEVGSGDAATDGIELAETAPSAIYAGPEEATKQTGTIIAQALEKKLKTLKELRELDLGHWEGLTRQEFQERFAKVHRQWRSDPFSVSPPEGESVAEAETRLTQGIRKIVEQHDGQTVVAVLGRFAGAIVRCRLSDAGYEPFWEFVNGERARHVFDLTRESIPDPARSSSSDKSEKTRSDQSST